MTITVNHPTPTTVEVLSVGELRRGHIYLLCDDDGKPETGVSPIVGVDSFLDECNQRVYGVYMDGAAYWHSNDRKARFIEVDAEVTLTY